MTNELMIPEMSWQALVEQVFADVDLKDNDIPENVVAALEYLLAGLPVPDVAKRIGKSPRTVRNWLKEYPVMAVALSRGEELLAQWRKTQISGQFADALKVSQDVLNADHTGATEVDGKVLAIKAQHSRYIIGLMFGQKSDITVTHEVGESVLAANPDALDYLAMQMQSARDAGVPARYEIVDGEHRDVIPILDEHGNPLFGEMGHISTDEHGQFKCHICGNYFKSLDKHVHSKHGLSRGDYEAVFMLEPGTLGRLNGKQE